MSLILEALKKSEANRRLGAAPDLGTPFSTRSQRPNMVPLLAVAIVIAGVAGWWFLHNPAPVEPTTASTSTAKNVAPTNLHAIPDHAASAVVAKPVPAAPKPAPVATTADNFPVAPPGDPSAPPITPTIRRGPGSGRTTPMGTPGARFAVTPAQPAATPAKTDKPAVVVATAPAPASIKADNPVAVAAAPAPAAPKSDKLDAIAASPKPIEPDNNPPARAPKTAATIGLTPAATTPAAAPAPAQPAATPGLSAQPYAELPFSVRKSLPELHLAMHVYAVDTAQRFVVLNQSRMTEGDKTPDDVTVREIRPDGVVLEFQGQRFFYPRDGL